MSSATFLYFFQKVALLIIYSYSCKSTKATKIGLYNIDVLFVIIIHSVCITNKSVFDSLYQKQKMFHARFSCLHTVTKLHFLVQVVNIEISI